MESYRVGPHVNRDHAAVARARPSIVEHIAAASASAREQADFRVGAVALFVGGPKSRQITLTDAEVAELREYAAAQRPPLAIVAHSTYNAPPWGGDPDAAAFVRQELAVCRRAGIAGLVVHLPKKPADVVLRYLPRLLEEAKEWAAEGEAAIPRIYLETPAVNARESYYETPEKLADLFAAIRREVDPGLRHVGLCVDTAHLWVCGVDLATREAAERWLTALEAVAGVIPPEAVMLHLNDSVRPRGVGPDSHDGLTHGRMWGGGAAVGDTGLVAFVDYLRRHDTITILERKPHEALIDDYLVLRKLL